MSDGKAKNPDEALETVFGDMAVAPSGKTWRADLWPNVPEAINWANLPPVCEAGEIVFNIRDNGQVWTYTMGFWD